MGRIIGFIVCIILGIGIIALSLINDSLYCSNSDNVCIMQTKIPGLNINISEFRFSSQDIEKVYCNKEYQPARNGKKKYFVLRLSKNNGEIYNLGTYKKYGMCNSEVKRMQNFLKKSSSDYSYNSGTGFSNTIGFIFGILLFVIGFTILFTKPEPEIDDFEDDSAD